MVLPTLSLTRFISGAPNLVFGLLLIEIGQSFGTSVGVTGQVGTVYSIIGGFTAILMGVISVRFNNRSLVLTGFARARVSLELLSEA